ncbi:MAG TPA: YetF domain-containing protein [Candidatus Limnocylindria bacterium]|nr:YetF domain-containing protein [Candidatus Limnocylindria bacterium]
MPSIPAWELILRAVLIYVALLVALRIFGKREVGQFTLYDLVFILLVANALQPAITGPDNSIGGGLVLILALVLTNAGVSRLDRIPRFHRLLAAAPAVIIQDGKYITEVMKREGVDQEEAETAMREHGVAHVEEVQLGVLEPDGSISIVAPGNATRTKRKVRFHQRSR